MEAEVKTLVSGLFERGTGDELMNILTHASRVSEIGKPFEEYTVYEQAALAAVEVVCLHLEKLGFIVGGSHEVH